MGERSQRNQLTAGWKESHDTRNERVEYLEGPGGARGKPPGISLKGVGRERESLLATLVERIEAAGR